LSVDATFLNVTGDLGVGKTAAVLAAVAGLDPASHYSGLHTFVFSPLTR
jgi:hypothetical protein